MKKYSVFAQATASKYLGTIEANSQEEAEMLAWKKYKEDCYIDTNISNDFEVDDTDMCVEEL